MDATTTSAARPTTCGAYIALHADKAEGRLASCKRLPMHKGECRAFLTIAAEHRSTRVKSSKKTSTKLSRAGILKAAAALAEGKMTPSAYLSLVSRYGQRKAVKALVTTEVVA